MVEVGDLKYDCMDQVEAKEVALDWDWAIYTNIHIINCLRVGVLDIYLYI